MEATQRAPRGIPTAYDGWTVVRAQEEATVVPGGEKYGIESIHLYATAEIQVGTDEVKLSVQRRTARGADEPETITLRREDVGDVLALFAKASVAVSKAARAAEQIDNAAWAARRAEKAARTAAH